MMNDMKIYKHAKHKDFQNYVFSVPKAKVVL